jgi:hypothetical protein
MVRVVRLLLRPVSLAVLSLGCVAGAAIAAVADATQTLFCQDVSGANIDQAVNVVFFGCLPLTLIALLVGLVAPARSIPLAVALLLDAAALAVAVAFVALDAATYQGGNCTLGGPPSPRHVGYLYIAWGVPLAVLLMRAGRVLLTGTGKSKAGQRPRPGRRGLLRGLHEAKRRAG